MRGWDWNLINMIFGVGFNPFSYRVLGFIMEGKSEIARVVAVTTWWCRHNLRIFSTCLHETALSHLVPMCHVLLASFWQESTCVATWNFKIISVSPCWFEGFGKILPITVTTLLLFYFENLYSRLSVRYSRGNFADLGQLYDLFV